MNKDWFGYGMKGHKTKHIRAGRGFTLLEAMMAMVILAVAASGIFLSFATAASLQTEAHRRVLASRLAADMAQTIAATTFDQIETSFPAGFSQTASGMGNTGDAYTYFRCTVIANDTVPVNDGGQAVNLIRITVAAYYKDMEMTRVTTLIGSKIRN
jgi:prepilin-type N-terminal cleavage/methylation domain-containing protein